jgi:hypothetical protein
VLRSIPPYGLDPLQLPTSRVIGRAESTSYTFLVTEGLRTVAVAGVGLAVGCGWHALRTSLIPPSSLDRLVSELRLGQFAALLLTMTAGVYIGFAVAHESQQGVGFDVAFAVGFLIVAASTLVRDPRHALTVLALAFAAHAVLDVAHRPGWLPETIAPRWYLIGCATYDVLIGARYRRFWGDGQWHTHHAGAHPSSCSH